MGTREGEARGNVASACVGAWHAGNMLHACGTRAPGVRALGPTGNQPHNTGSAGQADATTPVETRPPFHSHAPLWPCSRSPAARPALSLSARTEQPRMAVMSPLGQWAECREPLGTPPWGGPWGSWPPTSTSSCTASGPPRPPGSQASGAAGSAPGSAEGTGSAAGAPLRRSRLDLGLAPPWLSVQSQNKTKSQPPQNVETGGLPLGVGISGGRPSASPITVAADTHRHR